MNSKFFRVGFNSSYGRKKPVKAADLATLKRLACEEWGVRRHVRIFDEKDTEVTEEFLEFLESGSVVYICPEEPNNERPTIGTQQVLSNNNNGNISASAEGPVGTAMAFSQSRVKNVILNQGNTPPSEDDKRQKLMNDLKEKLQQSFVRIPMQDIPWMDKPLTVEDNYVDLSLRREAESGSEKQETKITMDDIFQLIEKGNKFTLIEGKPGFGKTTLCYKVAQLWAFGKLSSFDFVFITELRKHNTNSLKAFISQHKNKFNCQQVHSEELFKVLQHSKVLLILDGIDEIPYKKLDDVSKFIQEIQDTNNVQALLTCRPTEILKELKLNFSEKVIIRGFSKKGRREFVNQCFGEKLGSYNVDSILKIMENKVPELCKCPLMLLLFCLLIKNKPQHYELPESLTELFKEIVNFVINRYQEKISNETMYEKLDIFEATSNKETKAKKDALYSCGEKVFHAMIENRVTFTENEIQGDLPLRIGVLIRLSSGGNNLEVFHKSVSDFLCALHLSKIFLEDQKTFQDLFIRFLCEKEKEDSLILPFLCGLLKEKSEGVIALIPQWFYYGNWPNYFILFQECNRFLVNKEYLLKLNPPDLFLDVCIINEQVQILSKQLNGNFKITSIMNKPNWHNLNVKVHYSLFEYSPFRCGLSNFKGCSLNRVRIYFQCQNNGSECCEKPFSETQLGILMDEVLRLEPKTVKIYFPHCESSAHVMLERISKTNLSLKGLVLYDFNLQSEDVKEASVIICNQRLRYLVFANEIENVTTGKQVNKNVEIHPLIETIRNPNCVLEELQLNDVFIDKDDFKSLMDSISGSKTMNKLLIKFSLPSLNEVDFSQLCSNGRQWEMIELKNLNVILSSDQCLAIKWLILVNCKLKEEDSINLLPLCKTKTLRCDCQLLKALYCHHAVTSCSSQTLTELLIEDETLDVSPEIFLRFPNLELLWFDLTNGFKINENNKRNFIALLSSRNTALSMYFDLTFDTKEYLEIIDFIAECLHRNSRNPKVVENIKQIKLGFRSKCKLLNEVNVTILSRNETEKLLEFISKLHLFVSNGLVSQLVISIQQSNQKGHFLGPFLNIKNFFPEKDFEIQYQFQYYLLQMSNYAEWTITKRKEMKEGNEKRGIRKRKSSENLSSKMKRKMNVLGTN